MTRGKSRSATEKVGGGECCTPPPHHPFYISTYYRLRESGSSRHPSHQRARTPGPHLQ
jgi:hypothetical protein